MTPEGKQPNKSMIQYKKHGLHRLWAEVLSYPKPPDNGE